LSQIDIIDTNGLHFKRIEILLRKSKAQIAPPASN